MEQARTNAPKIDWGDYKYKPPAPCTPIATLNRAKGNAPQIDWANYRPPAPKFLGTTLNLDDINLEALIPYIDWSPFFIAWELAGKYPQILEDAKVGKAATALYEDAQKMLPRLAKDGVLMGARAVIGLWPANSSENDIIVYADESRKKELARLHHLRQQMVKPSGGPNFCLADWVAPVGFDLKDYIGGFVVTVGRKVEELAREYEEAGDDYSAILVKSLADRLAEAMAEKLHEAVRRTWWGYSSKENLSSDELIREKYDGIRPAPGYPACPDHTEKATLFKLLDAEEATGVTLTEHFAMSPAASVSGFYLSHPDSRYFGIGKIGEDQLADYAERKGLPIEEARRWLAPNLT